MLNKSFILDLKTLQSFLLFVSAEEPPVVEITSPQDNFPVNEGGSVDLVCVPRAGLPAPTLSWAMADNSALPTHSVKSDGANSVLTINRVTKDLCVDCIGENAAGRDTDTKCVKMMSKCATSVSLTRCFTGNWSKFQDHQNYFSPHNRCPNPHHPTHKLKLP